MPVIRASQQAQAALGGVMGEILMAQHRWIDAVNTTREVWDHGEHGTAGAITAILAASAAGDPQLIEQAARGRMLADQPGQLPVARASGHIVNALLALFDRRWEVARTEYLTAKRLLDEVGHLTRLARFQLTFSHLAGSRLPEAVEAGREAEAFFEERGASAYVAGYRAHATTLAQAEPVPLQPSGSRTPTKTPAT
jgi:hypothetical protein